MHFQFYAWWWNLLLFEIVYQNFPKVALASWTAANFLIFLTATISTLSILILNSIFFKSSRICQELLKRDNFAVHDEDSESNTALHLACIYGHSRVVSALISYGADIKARNYNLWTPLDCAAAYGQMKCAKILLEANADINPMDKNKVTPLHLAARNGHDKTVKLLIGCDKITLVRSLHCKQTADHIFRKWSLCYASQQLRS